ncbi:MAG: hypothetical protein ACOCV1_04345 [Bacillota bacterium]
MMEFITNIYVWMGATFLFLILFILLFIFIIVLAKKTHAIVEFKAWMKGVPIAMFFQENRYVEWRPLKPDSGLIEDKDYGTFIINEKATYIDRLTKNIILPFDAQLAGGVNIHAAKLADDLQYVMQDEEQMKMLRSAIANDQLSEAVNIDAIKTTVNIGAIKSMMTAMLPHNITAKIEKTIAQRMAGHGNVNVPQIALIFAAMFGAILLGAMVIKLAFPK